MFTIEVRRKGKDEEFGLSDLNAVHRECLGGKLSLRMEQTDGLTSVVPLKWEIRIRCERCGSHVDLPSSLEEEIKISLVKTAIDGQERKISDKVSLVAKA